MKKINQFILVLLMILFNFFNVGIVYSQTDPFGCCINPGAGSKACSSDLVRRTECCPTPQSSYQSYYNIAGGPSSPALCNTNYFRPDVSCSTVGECSLGCCCTAFGGDVKSQVQCNEPRVRFVADEADCVDVCNVPECNDKLDNDNNGCADSFDTGCFGISDDDESNGGCLDQSRGCNNPSYIPSLTVLQITPEKGKKSFYLTWSDECRTNALSYDIERCLGADCTNFVRIGSSTTASFTDGSDLLFDLSNDIVLDEYVYKYRITANYNNIISKPRVIGTANLGDIECYGKYDNTIFCVSASYYDSNQLIKGYLLSINPSYSANFAQAVSNAFAGKLNKAFSCNNRNKLTGSSSCSSSQICVASATTASCVSNNPQCSLGSFNPFGLFSTQQSCEQSTTSRNYCFYDKSYSSVDSCFACSSLMSCYDYKSEGACTRDNCGVSNCKWEFLGSDIGIGVCTNSFGYNCKWCKTEGTASLQNVNSYNKVFDLCTLEKSNALSEPGFECYFKQDQSYNCNEIICQDYLTTECSTAIRHDLDNKITTPSADKCGIKTCQNMNNQCVKNADGDGTADCSNRDCEKDYFPPETTISKRTNSNGIVNGLSLQISDKTRFDAPAIIASGNYITFLCAGSAGAPCGLSGHPFGVSSNSGSARVREIMISSLGVFDAVSGTRILTLNEGTNFLRYYSQDPSKNIEEIKTISFDAFMSYLEPRVLSIGIDNGVRVPVVTTPKLYIKKAQTSIDVEFIEDAVITFARVYDKNNQQNSVNLEGSADSQKAVKLLLPSALREGEYIFEMIAKNSKGVSMPLFSYSIVVDNLAPELTAVPADNSLITSLPISASLTFNEDVDLDSIELNGEDKKGVFSPVTNKRFTSVLPLNDGNYALKVAASDYAENTVTKTISFVVNHDPTKITMTKPKFNVASSYVFDIEIRTDNNVECKYSLDDIISDFNFMSSFTTTGGINHLISGFSRLQSSDTSIHKLYVACYDKNYPVPSGQYRRENFSISVDTTKPVITIKSANPNPVSELPSSIFQNNTILQVQTDEPTVCKYSDDNGVAFENMGKFNGFDEADFKTTHTKPIAVQNDISYNIICRNRAELLSEPAEISINVDLDAPFKIDASYMNSLYTSNSAELIVHTNKNVICFYSKTSQSPVNNGDRLGDGGYVHKKLLTSLNDGQYTYYIQCQDTSGAKSYVENVNFTVDTTAPRMLFVNDTSTLANPPNPLAEMTCTQDKLRVKWLGQDSYKVRDYSYQIFKSQNNQNTQIQNWQTTSWYSDSQNGNEWNWIDGLSLEEGTKYFFRVKSSDYGNLESSSLDSNGITVNKDACRVRACGDGIIDTGEECDDNGLQFGSIDSCLDYSNFIGGVLSCSQCRVDTTGCVRQAACGDGKISPGEECDGSVFGAASKCSDLGFASGNLNCGGNCLLDTSKCMPKQTCGNGAIDVGEECDGTNLGPLNSSSCTAYDSLFTGGTLRCSSCRLDTNQCFGTTGSCNNGIINIGEACDGTNFGAIEKCEDYGIFSSGVLTCTNQCRLNTTGCVPVPNCGNDLINPGESCDGKNFGILTPSCAQYSTYFSGGALSCTKSCSLNTTNCAPSSLCGNGAIDGDEQCDGIKFVGLNDSRCSSYRNTFVNGTIACESCRISTGSCRTNRTINNMTCRDTASCGLGINCTDGSDCQSKFCSSGKCAAPNCQDRTKNQNETDVDCGGVCTKCIDYKICRSNGDCLSDLCEFGLCKAKNACSDGKLSTAETDVDCGGPCQKCDEGKNCNANADCKAGYKCTASSCKKCAEGEFSCGDSSVAPQRDKDSDKDGMPDDWEIKNGLDPNDPSDAKKDNDNDGLSNLEEYEVQKEYGKSTNPNNSDTDGDGYSDKKEVDDGKSPVNVEEFPKSSILKILMFIFVALVIVSGFGYLAYRTVQARQGSQPRYMQRRAPEARAMTPLSVGTKAQQQPKTREDIMRLRELIKKREAQRQSERKSLFGSFNEKKKVEFKKSEIKKVEDKKTAKREANPQETKKSPQKPVKKSKDVFAKLRQIAKK